MRTKTNSLAKWAGAAIFCAILSVAYRLTADGQVPLIASYLHWNSSTSLSTQGGYLGWSVAGLGESDFENQQGSGVGGFNWYNTSSLTLLMSLNSSGVLTPTGGFAGALTGNVTGNLTGNSSGTTSSYSTGQFGNLIAACSSPCPSGIPWNPGSIATGTWFGYNNNGGSNGESDFINRYTAGNLGGFSWWSTTATSLSSQIMNLSNAGVLTLSSVHAALVGNVTGNVTGSSGSTTGNAATATALAATPSQCGTNTYSTGIAASGAANCGPKWLMASTGTVCTTSTAAGSTCTSTVTWPAPQFSGGSYFVVCSGASPSGAPQGPFVTGQTGSTVTFQISNGTASQAVASTLGSVTCWGQQ